MSAQESVEKIVVDALAEFGFDRAEISMDASLADLDVSSLDVVELLQIIQHEFGVQLPAEQIHGCETLDQLISLIASHVRAAGAA